MTDAILFSWSGSFKEDLAERHEEITRLITIAHDTHEMEVGILSEDDRDTTEEHVDRLDIDFAVGNIENILEVTRSLAQKYDKVFFVSDVRAELVAVNQSGAYTIGVNSANVSADELGGVGPNYIIDALDELEQILLLEAMD